MPASDTPTCICPADIERTCINPLCPRRPVHQRQVPQTGFMPGFWRNFIPNRRLLHAAFPAAFPKSGQPRRALANGIHAPMKACGAIPADQVEGFLRAWTSQPSYVAALAAGGLRINLDGSDATAILPDEQERAQRRAERAARRKEAA